MLADLLVPVWLIEFLYALWALVATIVVVLSGHALYGQYRIREYWSRRSLFMLGIFCSWSGSASVRWWFMAWLLMGQPPWFLQSWLLALACVDIVIGGLIHIYSFTRHRYQARFVLWSCVLSVAGAAAITMGGHI